MNPPSAIAALLDGLVRLIGSLINGTVRGIEKGTHHAYHVRTFPWTVVGWLLLALLALTTGSLLLIVLTLLAAVALWMTRSSPYRPEARIVFAALGLALFSLSIAGTLGLVMVFAVSAGGCYWWQEPIGRWMQLRISLHRVHHATGGRAVVDARPDDRHLLIHATAHHRIDDIDAEPIARVHNARTAVILTDGQPAGRAIVELHFGPDPLEPRPDRMAWSQLAVGSRAGRDLRNQRARHGQPARPEPAARRGAGGREVEPDATVPRCRRRRP